MLGNKFLYYRVKEKGSWVNGKMFSLLIEKVVFNKNRKHSSSIFIYNIIRNHTLSLNDWRVSFESQPCPVYSSNHCLDQQIELHFKIPFQTIIYSIQKLWRGSRIWSVCRDKGEIASLHQNIWFDRERKRRATNFTNNSRRLIEINEMASYLPEGTVGGDHDAKRSDPKRELKEAQIKAPAVPGMPCKSFILTAGRITNISLKPSPRSSASERDERSRVGIPPRRHSPPPPPPPSGFSSQSRRKGSDSGDGGRNRDRKNPNRPIDSEQARERNTRLAGDRQGKINK